MVIEYLFDILFFLVPIFFYPKTSEVFEFNKLILVYVFTTLIAASWLIRMIIEKKIVFRRTFLDIPLLIFLLGQVISTIFSIDVRTSIFGYYSRFNGGLLSIICYLILYWAFVSNMKKVNLKRFIYSILISATIVAVYGILEHFGHSFSCLFVTNKFDDQCWVQDVQSRVFATLGQPNWLAAYLISLIPLTWYLAITGDWSKNFIKENREKLLWILVSLLFFGCILFTKSRSGLFGLAAADGIFWIGIIWKNFKNKKIFKNYVLVFISLHVLFLFAIGIFGTAITPSIKDFISKKPVTQSVDTSEGGTESGAIREIVWKGAIDIFYHYPIFGTGVETFGYSYWQFRPVAHNNTSEWNFLYNKAHNEFLNYLANSGAFGFISYITVIIGSIYQMSKQKKNSKNENWIIKIALVAGYVSILITNFFGFSVVIVSLLFYIFPAIGILTDDKDE